jgi:DNA-binding phage protein
VLEVVAVDRETGNYDEYHLEWLKNPANAAAFLNSVMEEYERGTFVQALRDVASAQNGMMATDKSLSKRGCLKFSSITELLHGMGVCLTVELDNYFLSSQQATGNCTLRKKKRQKKGTD